MDDLLGQQTGSDTKAFVRYVPWKTIGQMTLEINEIKAEPENKMDQEKHCNVLYWYRNF